MEERQVMNRSKQQNEMPEAEGEGKTMISAQAS